MMLSLSSLFVSGFSSTPVLGLMISLLLSLDSFDSLLSGGVTVTGEMVVLPSPSVLLFRPPTPDLEGEDNCC